jgi:hypothetical protein
MFRGSEPPFKHPIYIYQPQVDGSIPLAGSMDLPLWTSSRSAVGVFAMMGLRDRIQNQPLPLNVIIVLCIWVLVGGLAWADSFDLTDDVGIPHASAGAVVDSDGDETSEKLGAVVRASGSLFGQMSPLTMPQLLPVPFSSLLVAQSQDPLYQRLCSLRI